MNPIFKLLKNMLAGIGVIALLVITINTAAKAGMEQINDAFDRQEAGQTAMIANHKAYLAQDDDNYVTDPMNGFDDEVYEASEQAGTARHANQLIANAYGRE